MVKFFIGVDISKDTLDIHVKSIDNLFNEHLRIDNTPEGFKELGETLKKINVAAKQAWFCAEHTGRYGLMMQAQFETRGWMYSLVPAREIMQSIGMQRGKSDKVDAARIAEYAMRFTDKLKPTKLPSDVVSAIKELFILRALLVKQRSQLKNSLKKPCQTTHKSTAKHVVKILKNKLKAINKEIKQTEDLLDEVIGEDQQVKNNFDMLTSVTGIGQITSVYLIAVTNNFNDFDSARKLASYSGLAPFEHTSGSSIKGKTRVSKFRNQVLKTLLINGVNTAIQHDPELKMYYQRKVQEGKHPKQVKNAVANKLVLRAFAVVKRKTPFVKVYSTNFAQRA